MALSLLDFEDQQPTTGLLPVDDRPPSLQPDPRAQALGQLYQQVMDQIERDHRRSWSPDNPVGTETTRPQQTIGMPDPSFRPGVFAGGGTVPMSAEQIDAIRSGSQDVYDQLALTGGMGRGGQAFPGTGSVALASRRPLARPPPPSPAGLLGEAATSGGARPSASAMKLNPDAVGFADRISTRLPSLTADVHDSPNYTVDYDSFLGAPKVFQPRAAEAIGRHIGLTDPSPEGLIDHLGGNIRAVWDAVPEAWRGGAMNWYNGARSLAEQMADRYGTSVRAQAANLAALSPQRQWEHNVEGAMRVGDAVANHADTPWSDAHAAAWNGPGGFAETNPKWAPNYAAIEGKTLGEIDSPADAALWFRLHDRAFAPNTNARVVNPDGTFGDVLAKQNGEPEKIQWGGLGEIGNAISSLRDDSLSNISRNMGNAHKVRNFYNNIVSPDAGHDVTIDTHAVAAALLRPLGSKNPEVSYGLGSPVDKAYRSGPDIWPSTMESGPAGLKGIYPLYAEAYRRVADQLGVLPRQLQSVTWEGIRGLYNDADRKSAPLARSTGDLWRAVSNGDITPDAARAQLLSRGIRPPNWTGADLP